MINDFLPSPSECHPMHLSTGHTRPPTGIVLQGLLGARGPPRHHLVESISFTLRLRGDNGARNYHYRYVRTTNSRVRLPAPLPVLRLLAFKHQGYLLTLYSVSHVISIRRMAYISLK